MRWTDIVDTNEVKKTIDILKPEHQLFEIRILGSNKRNVLSGYFTDSATLLEALDSVDLRNTNVYITLNKVNEALYSRSQHDKFVNNTNTTSDPEIDAYQWLFIDFDPVRPTNISSSDEELKLAEVSKNKVKDFLASLGFPAPVVALSGNGYHLLYRVNLPNNQEGVDIISNCLNVLSNIFNTDTVKVDTTNCNPSRICKLHGTLAQKGANTSSRPHRMSRIIEAPEQIQVTSKDALLMLIAQLPQETKKPAAKQSNIKAEFDITDWLYRYGFSYKEDIGRDCQIFKLDECPFDHNHRDGDAKIFAYTNGAVAFKCHHNSCKGKTWQDVRVKFEPDAYDQKQDDARIEEGYRKHKKQKEDEIFIPLSDEEARPKASKKSTPKKKRKLKTAVDLLKKNLPAPRVLVGIGEELPLLVEGTCILSAKPKLGKSWFVLAMCMAMAKGEDFLGYKTERCSTLYLDLETSEQLQQVRITKALNGSDVPANFYIDTETDDLDHGFVEQIEDYLEQDPNIGIVVIDVFQIIRSKAVSSKESEYEHAYRDITPLNELAQRRHISIILICHDRKAVDPDDPFSNILGSTGLQGAATQMMVMFRKRKTDPIHISIKGKTIDGLPDLDVILEKGQWRIVSAVNEAERTKKEYLEEYLNSTIRQGVVEIANNKKWKGRCSAIISEALEYGVAISEDAKHIGGFLHRHLARFYEEDGIRVKVIDNGTGPKIYEIEKTYGMVAAKENEIEYF